VLQRIYYLGIGRILIKHCFNDPKFVATVGRARQAAILSKAWQEAIQAVAAAATVRGRGAAAAAAAAKAQLQGIEQEANRAGLAQPLPAGSMFVSPGFLELDQRTGGALNQCAENSQWNLTGYCGLSICLCLPQC
jgi:hypothetical protein